MIDVVAALTDSVNPRDYWFKMKVRVKTEEGFQLSTICRQLKMEAPDGKMRATDCASAEALFRIIQSIPSPRAEPFKQWLAKVGYERIQDMSDPARSLDRARYCGFPTPSSAAESTSRFARAGASRIFIAS